MSLVRANIATKKKTLAVVSGWPLVRSSYCKEQVCLESFLTGCNVPSAVVGSKMSSFVRTRGLGMVMAVSIPVLSERQSQARKTVK
jgi:hypothetical protein